MTAAPLITAAQLRLFAPRCDYLALGPKFDASCRAHGISTPRRLRHFMAHAHVESGGLVRLVEDLNYSAQRLTEVWPKRFPSIVEAAHFAHNPQRLAEKVYGGRLGNVQLGDGWRFRGRGFFQLTGRANYGRAQAWSGLDLVVQPDLAAQPSTAVEIAASFWETEGLNAVVDADDDERAIAVLADRLRLNEADDVLEATREINGGTNGLKDRQAQLLRAATIWN